MKVATQIDLVELSSRVSAKYLKRVQIKLGEIEQACLDMHNAHAQGNESARLEARSRLGERKRSLLRFIRNKDPQL